MHPIAVFKDFFHGLLELDHRAEIIRGDGDAAGHPDPGAVGAFQIGLPGWEITQFRPQGHHNTYVIPHKHMVRNGDHTLIQNRLMLLEFFLAMDMKAMAQPHHQGQHRVLADTQQSTLQLKKGRFLQIGIIFIAIDIPQVFDRNHMLVAFFGILIGQIVSKIHVIPSPIRIFPILSQPAGQVKEKVLLTVTKFELSIKKKKKKKEFWKNCYHELKSLKYFNYTL